MADISMKNIMKVYPGDVTAVNDFNLEIEDKEFIILVGPSGCGKSTTLRMIAGLEDITSGELRIGGNLVNDVPPKDRDIAMVFQNYALYPHMTVYKNMAFGLSLRKTPKEEIDRQVREAAKLLQIENLLDRKPKALSGGQRQRVALGRAMVRDPSVFLLDEPLSNLDAKLRTEMRTVIAKLHKRLGTTFVYVTHDQMEAMTMGDRIVVMKDGLIQQVDTPQKLYDAPCNIFVGGFIGSPQMNFADAVIKESAGHYSLVVEGAEFALPESKTADKKLEPYIGKTVVMGIRAEDIGAALAGEAEQVEMVVDFTEMMGAEAYVYLKMGQEKFVSKMPISVTAKTGDPMKIVMNMEKVHLFDKETELVICN